MRAVRLTLVVLLAAASAWAVDPQRLALARAKVGKAEKQLKKENFDKAEKLFRAAIEDEPEFPDSYLGLATVLCARQRYEEALPILDQAENAYVRWHQTASETEMEARQEAAERARQFRDLQQQQRARAGGTQQQQQSQPALNLANLAAARVATEDFLARRGWKYDDFAAIPAPVFYLAGLCRLRTGDRDGAIEALRVCVTSDPAHGLAHYNLSVALFTAGDVAGAAEHLEAAREAGIEPNPQFAEDLERRLAASKGERPPGE